MTLLSFLQRLHFRRLLALAQQLAWSSVLLGFATPLVLVLGYHFLGNSGTSAQEVVGEIVTVGRRDITLSIKALGSVTLANEQQLRFNVQGKVEKVHVKTGDTVKRDDLIAELDKTDPNADIRQAQLSVNDAYLKLQDLQASRDETLLTAENSVRDLQRQLEEANGDLPSQQMEAEDLIAQAETTVKEKEAAYEKAQHDLAASIESSIASADGILDSVIAILSGDSVVRGAVRYKAFEIAFYFTDYDLKNKTEFAYYDASNTYDALREEYGSLQDVDDTKQLESALEDAITMAQKIIDLTNISYDFLRTAVPSTQYTDADINEWKTTINTKRTAALSLLNTLRDQQAMLTQPGKSAAFQDLEDAKNNLEVLRSQQENGTTTADSAQRTIENLNDKLSAGQANLKQTTTSVNIQISQQSNALAQKQVALEKARRALENYELRAPFDGIVRRVDFQVGDNLLADASETKYVVLENPEYFIVTVQLDQVDVVNVKEGQKAFITFDAVPNVAFEGTINLIDTTPVQTSGVVSYEVEIMLAPSEQYTILSGMTATVEIQTASAVNALAVPALALRTQGNRTFVTREDGASIPVETGITNGSYTEILSGIEEGTRIQSISVSLNAAETSGEESTNRGGGIMMPMGGMGGGPPRM
ncbi:MAG: HlyD family efflux transporter periplasmic adaptor subunit [Candidatus Peribacteraceae bacterium]|nr:HlyD family efflux transporter periplasmic adaptor subunit [Candidatus Peribacteraceae bacterium]